MLERLVFPNFFLLLTVSGALAGWALVCWGAALLALSIPPALHVIGPMLLGLVVWGPARRAERWMAPSLRAEHAGRVVLAAAFVALASAGALAVTTTLWAGLRLLGALRAEASVVAPLPGEPFFGWAFHVLAGGVLAFTAATLAYGYTRGLRRIEVTNVSVPISGLPPGTTLRIVQLSDLHLGPLASRDALREAIARVGALEPDLVCITGDVVDSPATDLDAWLPELAPLTAPLGVFAILGNHDRHTGADTIAGALRRTTGWTILRDEIATIALGDARLHVVGLEDGRQAGPRLRALLGRVPEGAPTVLLIHHPKTFPLAAAAGVPLVLAGHTHGGQIALPGLSHVNVARFLISRFDAGSFMAGRSVLHVNRGLGTSGQPVRVGVPAEITLVVAKPA